MAWSGADLAVIDGKWGCLWSTADAAWLLDLPVRDVRDALRRGGVEPAGKRYDQGRGTRHVRVYDAKDVLKALGMTAECYQGSL